MPNTPLEADKDHAEFKGLTLKAIQMFFDFDRNPLQLLSVDEIFDKADEDLLTALL